MSWMFYFAAVILAGFLLFLLRPWFCFLFSAVSVALRKRRESCNCPDDVIEIRDGYVSLWLLRAGDGYIAFDAGQRIKPVKAALQKTGVSPSQVKQIFLTHSDPDHAGAVTVFSEAAVYLAAAEEVLLNGTGKRTFSGNRISVRGNRLKVPYSTLKDGQVLNALGKRIECILTPGHTPGSMCYLVDDCYLFTGDTLSLENGRFTRFIPVFSMNTRENERSIRKLAETIRSRPVKYVFTGHDGCAGNLKRAIEGW